MKLLPVATCHFRLVAQLPSYRKALSVAESAHGREKGLPVDFSWLSLGAFALEEVLINTTKN
jgi:hypothetical protein